MNNHLKYPNYYFFDNIYKLCQKWECNRLLEILNKYQKPIKIQFDHIIYFNNNKFLINKNIFFKKIKNFKNLNYSIEEFELFLKFIHEEILFDYSISTFLLLYEFKCFKLIKEIENNYSLIKINILKLFIPFELPNLNQIINLISNSIDLYLEEELFSKLSISILFKIFLNFNFLKKINL